MFRFVFHDKWAAKVGLLYNHVSKLKNTEVEEIINTALKSLLPIFKKQGKENKNYQDYRLLFVEKNVIHVMKGIHQKAELHIRLAALRDNGQYADFHLYLVQHEDDDQDVTKTTFYYKAAYLSVSGNEKTETLPKGKRGATNKCFYQERRDSISFVGHQLALATQAQSTIAAASSSTQAASAASAAPV